ncbi:DUF6767 domain-containing protein [Dactylosporangium sp. CA-092794]|uniref:DUF6767 domain-containing protein n=1 Tax=Dactylosporangium sp. CA-092794 TaxID=3239929 RepID=UPI003D8E7713
MSERRSRLPEPRCPVRPGEPCTLCQPGATGPQDCGLVYLVMSDPELRAGIAAQRAAARGRGPAEEGTSVPAGWGGSAPAAGAPRG